MAGDIAKQVAVPYAEAMLSIATGQDAVDKFGEDARGILAVLEQTPELSSFLASPLATAEQKKALITQAFGDSIHPMVTNVLMILADRRRIVFLEQVCEHYLTLQRKLQKIALAEVTSVSPLNDNQKQAVVDRVKRLTGSIGVELKESIDSDLIGGVIIRVGSQVIDASLRGQLRRLAFQLS
ncbi:MAG: ATP synthase F1 subunit delta [Cyanobacteria bacterium P01_A01_bin.3]